MAFPQYPESSVNQLKRLYLQYNVWLNALKVDCNAELENTSFDFSTLNQREEIIYSYDTGNESKRESDFFVDTGDRDSSEVTFPLEMV